MRTTLFNAGPSCISDRVKQALLSDIGANTSHLTKLTESIKQQLLTIAGVDEGYCCIPLQGGDTFATEAMLTCLLPSTAHSLVLINGQGGQQLSDICRAYQLIHQSIFFDRMRPIPIADIDQYLSLHPEITHLTFTHFEIEYGICNPLTEILTCCHKHNVSVLVDTNHTFGLFTPNIREYSNLIALVSSSDKVLHGPSGIGFVIMKESLLDAPLPTRSYSLDLIRHYHVFERTGKWASTPPTQLLAGFSQAITQYIQSGGATARQQQYQRITRIITTGLAQFDIEPLLVPVNGSPILVFQLPFDQQIIDAGRIYRELLSYGITIYPQTETRPTHLRIGVTGEIPIMEADRLVSQVHKTLRPLLNTQGEQQCARSNREQLQI